MRLWCYSRGLRCAGGGDEIGKNTQTEETRPCEIISSFICVLFYVLYLHLSSALFDRATIISALTARALLQIS